MDKLEKIYLIDLEPQLVDEWEKQFEQYDTVVEPKLADYFDVEADCIVSPANSFGYMDGGLDLAITYELGQNIQDKVQTAITQEYYGELPVGSALIVETDSSKWPYLISAPTMRVPESVANSVNAYLAFRAILLTVSKFNSSVSGKKIKSLVCCGLATGIGEMSPRNCALQMKVAYEKCLLAPRVPLPSELHSEHFGMRAKR